MVVPNEMNPFSSTAELCATYGAPDYSSASDPSLFDANPDTPPIVPIRQFQHHQFQEEVSSHPGNTVNNHQSESYAGSHESICEWDNGSCGWTVDLGEVAKHMSTHHLQPRLPAASLLDCRWKGCRLSKPIRRDTIVRHIREKHLRQSR